MCAGRAVGEELLPACEAQPRVRLHDRALLDGGALPPARPQLDPAGALALARLQAIRRANREADVLVPLPVHRLVRTAAVGDGQAAHAASQWVDAAALVAVRALREGEGLVAHDDLVAREVRGERRAVLVAPNLLLRLLLVPDSPCVLLPLHRAPDVDVAPWRRRSVRLCERALLCLPLPLQLCLVSHVVAQKQRARWWRHRSGSRAHTLRAQNRPRSRHVAAAHPEHTREALGPEVFGGSHPCPIGSVAAMATSCGSTVARALVAPRKEVFSHQVSRRDFCERE